MSAGHSNNKLRFVPPAGRYSTPFFFAAYYTGGASSSTAHDHGPMLFSPLSSAPSGFYESGGATNTTHPSDAIGTDCTLLLSVAETRTGESIVSAQEAPLGRKMELPPGRYRVVGQLVSFGGHVFATNEAQYDVVAACDDNAGLATSALFDTLRNVQRHGGVPASTAASPGQQHRGGSGRQSPSASGSPLLGSSSTHQAPPQGGSHYASPQRSSTHEQIAATVRQSEEALSHAVAHFGAAAADAQSRISRQSSIDSRATAGHVGAGNKQQRPPLGQRGDATKSTGGGANAAGGTALESDGEENDDANDPHRRASHADAAFALPPPSVLHHGAPLLFGMRPRVQDGGASSDGRPRGARTTDAATVSYPYNVLLQQEVGDHRQANTTCVAPTFLYVDAVRIEGLPLVARGIGLHWSLAGGSRVGLTSTKGGTQLSAQQSHTWPSKQLQHHQQSHTTLDTVVARSVETIGFTGRDGVLSGLQFSLGDQTPAYAGDGTSNGIGLLISIRPTAVVPDGSPMHRIVPYLPYLDITPIPHRPLSAARADGRMREEMDPSPSWFQLQWKASGVVRDHDRRGLPVDAATDHMDGSNGSGGDVVLYECTVSAHDVLALHFDVQTDSPGLPWASSPEQRSARPSVDAVLRVNHVAVCRTAIPTEAMDAFDGGQHAAAPPLHAIVLARPMGALSSPRRGADGLAASVPLCRNIVALSHYTATVDVLVVPADAIHTQRDQQQPDRNPAGGGAGDVRARSTPQRHLYVWRRGQPVEGAAKAVLLLYNHTATAS